MVVIIGSAIDPGCPARFNRIWSMYETYMAIANIDANQPIIPTFF